MTVPAQTYRAVRQRAAKIAAGRGLSEQQQRDVITRAQTTLHESASIGHAIAAASQLAGAFTLDNAARDRGRAA